MSIKSVMPSNHLLICHSLLFPPSIFPSIRVFSNESGLYIRWPDKITGKIDGEKVEIVTDFIFLGSKITTHGDCSHEIERQLLPGRKAMANLDSVLKSRDISCKGLSRQSFVFSSNHVWMWELDHIESWVLKNWCFWIVVQEKTLESPLDCKEIKPVNP